MTAIAIARNIPDDKIEAALMAAFSGGFDRLEITMNSQNAAAQISRMQGVFSHKAKIGAGTVRNMKELEEALNAGARFIVCPNTNLQVIKTCIEAGIEIFPGALTPSEIYSAWEAGATMVKVFPVKSMGGASYVKELKGPYDQVKLLACGGVSETNLSEYKAAGISGFAVGGSLFDKSWLDRNDFAAIESKAGKYFL